MQTNKIRRNGKITWPKILIEMIKLYVSETVPFYLNRVFILMAPTPANNL